MIDQAQKWQSLARNLILFTILYNLVEAGVSILSGLAAGSISLLGFGLDSIIETAAAGVLLWRFSSDVKAGEVDEGREAFIRRFIGGTFFLLAAYIVVESGINLWQQHRPEESLIGIVIAIASLVIMPVLVWGKLRVAERMNYKPLAMEAKETLACLLLSAILLIGLLSYALLGWWWMDSVAALAMVPWLVKEGREGFEEDGCCG
mgnify:CR=1 FL=1